MMRRPRRPARFAAIAAVTAFVFWAGCSGRSSALQSPADAMTARDAQGDGVVRTVGDTATGATDVFVLDSDANQAQSDARVQDASLPADAPGEIRDGSARTDGVVLVADTATSPDGSVDAGDARGATGGPTRLDTWRLEADGTGPLVLGIWDTRENVHCRFVPDETGQLRCLPEVARYLFGQGNTFADARCQQPVWVVQQDEDKSPLRRPWSQALSQAGCGAVRYQVLRPVPEASALYSTSSGPCKAIKQSDILSTSVPQLPLTPDPPDRWETGTESTDVRLSDRLRVVEDVTPEGARFANRIVDDRWGMACSMTSDFVGDGIVCRPPSIDDYGSTFSDAACTAQLYALPACQQAAFIGGRGQPAYNLGALYLGDWYRRALGCEKSPVPTSSDPSATRYYLRGDLLDATEAPVREDNAPGTGRFRVRGVVDMTGAVVPLPKDLLFGGYRPFFDTVANEDCRLIWTPDGQVRCAPLSTAVVTPYFTDNQCKVPGYVCDQGAGCDGQKVVFVKIDQHARAIAQAAYSNTTALTTSPVPIYGGNPCQMVGNIQSKVYGPGTPIPWDTFPSLREVHPIPTGP